MHEPDIPARNRKPLLRGAAIGATWELRCGPGNSFRIFYDVHRDQHLVVILALARKVGNHEDRATGRSRHWQRSRTD